MEHSLLKTLDRAQDNLSRKIIIKNILVGYNGIFEIKEIFKRLSTRNYFSSIASTLFDYIIYYPEYMGNEITYLISLDSVRLIFVTYGRLKDLLKYLPDSLDFILDKAADLDLTNQLIIELLLDNSLANEGYKNKLLKAIFLSGSEIVLKTFTLEITKKKYNFDFSLFLPFLFMTNIDNAPSLLASLAYLNKNLKSFLVNYFSVILPLEKVDILDFIAFLKSDLSTRVLKDYEYLFKIYQVTTQKKLTYQMLNTILKNKDDGFIRDYIGCEEVFYLKYGSTAIAYRIGDDKVLKLSAYKHDKLSILEHFLLAPTERKVIYRELKPILYIEKQKYLASEYNGEPINKLDLDNFFNELDRQNLVLTDPHCVRMDYDNFGFLNDYHEAQLVGVSNYDELPEWFKLRPLVLFDIDMIREKEDNLKKRTNSLK